MDVNKNKHIITHAGNVTFATLCSRIFGFIRDALVAFIFGASTFSDAFYAAYRIANLFRRLFGEGAFASSFIPVLAAYISKGKKQENDLVRTVMGNLLCVTVFLTALGILIAPVLVWFLVTGFRNNPEQIALTVSLTRIMFPYFIFISLAACLMGVLQINKIFFIPAIAPVSLSLSIIAYVLVILPVFGADWSLHQTAVGLSVSVLIGGFGHLLFMIPVYMRKGYSILPKINFNHTGSRRVFTLMLPAMFGISIDQINMFISATFLASFLAKGSVTALYYSDRITQFPLALFGIAMSSVALPLMSRAHAAGKTGEIKEILNYSVRMVGYLVIPSMVGLIILGLPIIQLLFERGAFDSRATSLTYAALVPYSCAIIFFSLVRLFANAFYAMQDMKKPVIIASVSMIINIILAFILMRPFGIAGIGTASAVSSGINVVVLAVYLRKKIGLLGGKKICISYTLMAVAAGTMGAAVLAVSRLMHNTLPGIRVLVSVGIGVAVYSAAAHLLHIEERKQIFDFFKRSRKTQE